jgi:hypothetical protein
MLITSLVFQLLFPKWLLLKALNAKIDVLPRHHLLLIKGCVSKDMDLNFENNYYEDRGIVKKKRCRCPENLFFSALLIIALIQGHVHVV